MAPQLVGCSDIPLSGLLLGSQCVDLLSSSQQAAVVLLLDFGPNVI